MPVVQGGEENYEGQSKIKVCAPFPETKNKRKYNCLSGQSKSIIYMG